MNEMDYEKYRQKIESMDMVFRKLIFLEESETEEQLNQRIPFLLEAVGNYTKSDRVYIFDWIPVLEEKYHNTFEWCREGVRSQLEILQNVPVTCMSNWHERFEQGKSIVLADVEEIRYTMPSEFELLTMQDIYSEISVPVFYKNKLSGFIGLDNPEVSFLEISAKLMRDVGIHLSYVRENRKILSQLQNKENH